MRHFIKIQKQFADAILSGDKTFEIRENDRAYQKGDTIKFTVLVDGVPKDHPLNDRVYQITYVLSGWGLKNGYVVFGIREIEGK